MSPAIGIGSVVDGEVIYNIRALVFWRKQFHSDRPVPGVGLAGWTAGEICLQVCDRRIDLAVLLGKCMGHPGRYYQTTDAIGDVGKLTCSDIGRYVTAADRIDGSFRGGVSCSQHLTDLNLILEVAEYRIVS